MPFVLNGVTLIDPNAFYPYRERVEVSERAAAGNLCTDVKAVKMRFSIYYNILTGTEISPFLTLYDNGTYVNFQYPEGGTQKSKTVRVADVQHALIYYTPTEYWKGVKISLVEQ